MSVLRARRPMLVAALLGLSLTAAGCGLGGSGDTAGGLKADPSLAVDPGASESPARPDGGGHHQRGPRCHRTCPSTGGSG